MSFETADSERKVLSILKVLSDRQKPLGSRRIAQNLKDYGVNLGERGIRYHLKLMDETGLTELVGNRDGRIITPKGLSEIGNALVKDKVGYSITRIELLAFRTDLDYKTLRGKVPVNVSFFKKTAFKKALQVMKPVFENNYCVSRLVNVTEGGKKIGDIFVPPDSVALATVCSIVVNGTLLKAGVPIDSRFGGILEVRKHKPARFTEIIHYNGSSLDPSEIFIKARMTTVREAADSGSGKILANFREIPAICQPVLKEVVQGLNNAGLGGVFLCGNTSEPVCEIDVEPNKIGLILMGGMNPVAAAQEAGIETENHSMSTVIEYSDLVNFFKIQA
jgi:HTH-type transcriptional regulator, global nitrogen regulator NrpRI